MLELKVGQTYSTFGGVAIRIVAKVQNDTHPFVGALTLWEADGQPHEVVRQYTPTGKLAPASDHYDDINLKENSNA